MIKNPLLTRKQRTSLLQNIATWAIVLVFVFVFVLTVVASFQSEADIKTGKFTLFNADWTLQNYADLLLEDTGVTAFRYNLWNSLVVSVGTSLLTVLVSVLGAYGLSHYQFKGKTVISKAMLFMYVFPTILLISPIYSVMASLNLLDTHLGLILIDTTLVAPFCIWLLESFFDSIPHSVEEAAAIDGASRWRIIWNIIIPLAAPGILTVAIYAMIYSWGEYTFAALLINGNENKTVPLALAAFMAHTDQKWGRLLAGCSLNFVPLLCMFMPLLKNFLKGFTAGAVKE